MWFRWCQPLLTCCSSPRVSASLSSCHSVSLCLTRHSSYWHWLILSFLLLPLFKCCLPYTPLPPIPCCTCVLCMECSTGHVVLRSEGLKHEFWPSGGGKADRTMTSSVKWYSERGGGGLWTANISPVVDTHSSVKQLNSDRTEALTASPNNWIWSFELFMWMIFYKLYLIHVTLQYTPVFPWHDLPWQGARVFWPSLTRHVCDAFCLYRKVWLGRPLSVRESERNL